MSNKQPLGKYMEIEVIENKAKTQVWKVTSKNHGNSLGIVKWYAPWRQYCFIPEEKTLFNSSCLLDIQGFLIRLNHNHRRG